MVQDRLECKIWEARSTHYVRWSTKCKLVLVMIGFSFRIEDLQAADVAMKRQQESEERGEGKANVDVMQSLEQNAKRFALNEQLS